jgi:hypothetical protein
MSRAADGKRPKRPKRSSGAPKGLRKQVRANFLARPEWIEPGVLLQDQALLLPSGRKVRLHGVDILGRPCVVGIFRELDADAYDWLLSVSCAFRDGILGGDAVYARGREPRLFVVAPWFRPEDIARLALLDEAVSVRALRLRKAPDGSWSSELMHPRLDVLDERVWEAHAPLSSHGFLSRLRAAARRGVQRCEFQGAPWPLLLVGPQGPLAAVHRDSERLLFLLAGGVDGSPQLIDLSSEGGQDAAIDAILLASPLLAEIAG